MYELGGCSIKECDHKAVQRVHGMLMHGHTDYCQHHLLEQKIKWAEQAIERAVEAESELPKLRKMMDDLNGKCI